MGEIAGNVYEFGLGQLKIDDGQFVLVHDNAFRSILGSVVFRVATEITDRRSRWLGFYQNHIEDNSVEGRYLINLTSGDYLYLLNNHYRNNTGKIDLNVDRGPEGDTRVFICPNSEEAQPLNASAFEGISPYVHRLVANDRLCEQDGGRYLFQD